MTTFKEAIRELLGDLDHAAFSLERNGPHVVVAYDPETASLHANGLYPDAPSALLAAEEQQADFNRPENNDSVDIVCLPVPLERTDGELQWTGLTTYEEWEVQFRVNPGGRWEHLESFGSEVDARTAMGRYTDPEMGVETRLRRRPVEIRHGAWEKVR